MPSSQSSPTTVQAGLLTPGSSYWLRLPNQTVSDMMQRSSPVTAAGPSPICTRFPIKFLRTPERCHAYTLKASRVKANITPLIIVCLAADELYSTDSSPDVFLKTIKTCTLWGVGRSPTGTGRNPECVMISGIKKSESLFAMKPYAYWIWIIKSDGEILGCVPAAVG
jgi:hypothetical protein